MSPEDLRVLTRDVFELAAVTMHADWSSPEGTMNPAKMAKAIPPRRWKEALELAIELSREIPQLPRPQLGADEFAGHPWLNYQVKGALVQLAVQDAVKGLVHWTIIRAEGAVRTSGTSSTLLTRTQNLREVVAMLTAVA